jgi:hypothetical protein
MEIKKIIGYDPGGNNRHGVAIVSVSSDGGRWKPLRLELKTLQCAQSVIELISRSAPEGNLLAVGIDTLTAWSGSKSGWRPADIWLRENYGEVKASVDNPNHINGSMCLNGALILHFLKKRTDRAAIEVTEAHPKVLYYALTNKRHPWSKNQAMSERENSAKWLMKTMTLDIDQDNLSRLNDSDHNFDALLGALTALNGLNREWTTDLHNFSPIIHPFGVSHYWWPPEKGTVNKALS